MLNIKRGNVGYEARQRDVDLKLSLVQEATDEEVRIELLIRERYTMSQELSLHRKKLMGTVSKTEWNAYCDYVEDCIRRVREGLAELEAEG